MADFGPGPSGGGSVQSGPRASFGIRLVAVLIDGFLLGIVGVVLRVILGDALGIVLQIVLGLAYYTYLEGSPSGQTVGKKAMNIRVVDFNTGGAIDPGRAFIRYLGRLLSGFACGLGYLWMLWDSEKQTWHDKIATTVVVPTSHYPVAAWPG
jgi:uncharacterized RDD family membrane protein YckC